MIRRAAHRPFSSQRGAALLVALCFATVLAVALASYITVCYRTLQLSARSVQVTRNVELAEIGMEEALWALNNNSWSGWTVVAKTASKTISGFAFDNGASGQVAITIANYDGTGGARKVTVVGTTTLADGTATSRTLTSGAAEAPLFTNAVAGTSGTVKFSAASATSLIDSYDSSNGLYSEQTPGYSAIISSGSTSGAATVQLTNAQVKGYVATLGTGPSYSTGATLKGPTTGATTKIDTSRITSSTYQPTFDIKGFSSVSTGGAPLATPASNAQVTLGTAGATSPAIYTSSGLNLTGTTKVTIDGPVRLVVSGDFYLGLNSGSPSFVISETGSLELFVSGDIAIYGGGFDNRTRDPQKLALYGTNTLSAPDMNTATAFHGVVYTPNGDFKVISNNDIYGAIVARNVVFSGNSPKVHYDLALRDAVFSGVETPFAVSDWRETTNESPAAELHGN